MSLTGYTDDRTIQEVQLKLFCSGLRHPLQGIANVSQQPTPNLKGGIGLWLCKDDPAGIGQALDAVQTKQRHDAQHRQSCPIRFKFWTQICLPTQFTLDRLGGAFGYL
jgi:hypothetical protein